MKKNFQPLLKAINTQIKLKDSFFKKFQTHFNNNFDILKYIRNNMEKTPNGQEVVIGKFITIKKDIFLNINIIQFLH